jgi:thiosulfate/3-mercaptopyruvate sulfurtransferase
VKRHLQEKADNALINQKERKEFYMNLRTLLTILTISATTIGTTLLSGCGSSAESTGNASGNSTSAPTAKAVQNFSSTDALAADQQNVLVVDVRAFNSYSTGHIPGAIRNPVTLNSTTPSATGAAGTLGLTQAEFISLADKLGITPSTKVVAYDTDNSSSVGRFVWTLLRYGHKNVAILDGGYQKWVAEGRPKVTKSASTPLNPNTASYVVTSVSDIDVDAAYVLSRINLPGTVIWDSRTVLEYIGADQKSNKRGGHIPYAVNLDWTNLQQKNSDGVFVLKSNVEILNMLQQYGITPDKEIIVHCQAGVRSAYVTDTLLGLGFTRVKNYTGSWGEWSDALKADGITYKYPISIGTNL